jgi:hypothetical protein
MATIKDNSEQYTKDFLEWQNKQYLSGSYLGGNLPPAYKYGGRKIGYVFFIQGLIYLPAGILLWFQPEQTMESIGLVVLGAVLAVAGLNKIRKSK